MQRALSTLLPIVFVLFAASHAYAQYSVTASWDANSDSFTAGYRIYYGTASGTYQWSVDVGNQTTAPLNLSPGSYFFAVRAYNSSYQYGPQSLEVRITVGSSSSAAPTATISATLQSSTWATVTWSTTNATSVTINGNAVGASGSAGMAVSGTTTFTIVARNAAGQTATASATATATGSTAAPTASIGASLDSPTTAFVTWTTTNATSATLNGQSVPVTSSVKVPISGTTTYTIVARNAAGQTATASATVVVAGSTPTPAPTATISATLLSSTSARVTWSTNNATSVTINGSAVAASGSTSMPVSGTTTFTIVARNATGQTATQSATVAGSTSTGAPTAAINASLDSPTTAFVTWTTTNATSATLNGSAIALDGSVKLPISGTTTYTIVARNAAGQTATANVTVVASGGGGTGGGSAPTATIRATLQSSTWATVTWSTTNATSVTINGNAVGPSGSAGMAVSGQTTFTILARNTSGQSATANVTVGGTSGGGSTSAPPTAAINASLDSPTTAFITWTTTNATSATLNGSSVPLVHSVKIPISGTTTYTIVARNAAGQTATASATVAVGGSSSTPAPTAWIGASLDSAHTAFVAWSSTNATSVTINGGQAAPSGSVKIPIYATTTYTIVVRDAAGRTATSAATVSVP